jgi:two-component system, NtrC family, nitrogen regulation response regulator GlnG
VTDGVVTLTQHVRGSTNGSLRLAVVDGPDRGKSLDLTAGAIRIGKSPESHLVLTDARVSRDHLIITVTDSDVIVRDLGSKNGTYLGGAKIQEAILLPGAMVQVGDTRLRLMSAIQSTKRAASDATSFGALTGASLAMREMYALLEAVAATNVSVLIEAETGCGKELCARAIHDRSARAEQPYIVCDLAGTSPSLLESELFGHVRGAFTGAAAARDGLFAEADGGTLFIDELGELDLALQPRLLRAIEARQVKAVGGNDYRDLDIRIIAATNRNLEEEVAGGRFREDLFHRLAVIRVRIPPLRERKEDLPELVRAFLGDRPIELPLETLEVLLAYDWPGNVRELRNVVERGAARTPDGGVLSAELLGIEGATAADELPRAAGNESFTQMRDRLIDVWERQALHQLMERCDGNVSRAAREGGLDRAYLHRLLKRHNLGRWAR